MDATTTLMLSNMVSSTLGLFQGVGWPIMQLLLTIFLIVFAIGVYLRYLRRGISRAAGLR